ALAPGTQLGPYEISVPPAPAPAAGAKSVNWARLPTAELIAHEIVLATGCSVCDRNHPRGMIRVKLKLVLVETFVRGLQSYSDSSWPQVRAYSQRHPVLH